MRINHIDAEGLLSFGEKTDRFHLELEQGLTILVGPNSTGKTNLIRVLTNAATCLDYLHGGINSNDPQLLFPMIQNFAANSRRAELKMGEPIRVEIGITMTTDQERKAIVHFFRAAILENIISNGSYGDLSLLENWLSNEVTEAALEQLMDGRIRLEHRGLPSDHWEVSYMFPRATPKYVWHLSGSHRTNTPPAGMVLAVPTTLTVFNQHEPKGKLGIDPGHQTQTPVPSMHFVLDEFLSERIGDQAGGTMLQAVTSHNGVRSYIEDEFLKALMLETRDSTFGRTFGFATVLHRVYGNALVASTNSPVLGEDSQSIGGEYSFGLYSQAEMTIPPPRWKPRYLPLRLFKAKNGSHTQQAQFLRIQGIFSSLLPDYRIDLSTNLFNVPASYGNPAQQATKITIEVSSVDKPATSLPIELMGSGIQQILLIAEQIAASDDRVLLLDEPGTSAHPIWQRMINTVINQQSQTLLVTHSPYMLPSGDSADLLKVSRFERRAGKTRVYNVRGYERLAALGADEQEQWLGRWRQIYSQEAEARGALFSDGVILCEGDTEYGVFTNWFNNSRIVSSDKNTLDRRGYMLLNVGSDTSFGPYLTLLNAFGIHWSIICDGPVLSPDYSHSLVDQFEIAGIPLVGALPTKAEPFATWIAYWEQQGVYTRANQFGGVHDESDKSGEIEAYFMRLDSKSYLLAQSKFKGSKPRAGYEFAYSIEWDKYPESMKELSLWSTNVIGHISHES